MCLHDPRKLCGAYVQKKTIHPSPFNSVLSISEILNIEAKICCQVCVINIHRCDFSQNVWITGPGQEPGRDLKTQLVLGHEAPSSADTSNM